MGFDTLSLGGLGLTPFESSCRLVYTEDPFKLDRLRVLLKGKKIARRHRWNGTMVSLLQPEEAFTVFPIDAQTANRCRLAWKSGAAAGKFVLLAVVVHDQIEGSNSTKWEIPDVQYDIVVKGTSVGRLTDEVSALAEFSLGVNSELCDGLQSIVSILSPDALTWLIKQMSSSPPPSGPHINNTDSELSWPQSQALCLVQAFFMGYYYSIFLPLVDTSSLRIQVVDGSWGYRSVQFLWDIRRGAAVFRTPDSFTNQYTANNRISRELVLMFLATLLLGDNNVDITSTGRMEKSCVGVIGVRTLLCNSLIKTCTKPVDIGGFTLLDVDTSGIPRDHVGLVRPGVHETEALTKSAFRDKNLFKTNLCLRGPDVDFTKHIEPDWNGNPENIVLVMRYKGRRVGSVDPAFADVMFCLAYKAPVEEPQCQIVKKAFECTLEDFLEGRIMQSTSKEPPTIIQAFNSPCMQYAAVGWYGRSQVALASNCIHTAIRDRGIGPGGVIAGYGTT